MALPEWMIEPVKVVNVRASTRVVYKEERFKCPYCKKLYGTIPGVAGHLVNYHAGEKIPRMRDLMISPKFK